MKKEVALLQRQLEAKERKMVELMKNAGSMPALKQHYDRVLAELESQRDTLVAERKSLMEVGRGLREGCWVAAARWAGLGGMPVEG